MNDHNRPWGSGPQGEHPTEQFWPGGPPLGGQPGPGGPVGGPAWQPDAGGNGPAWQQPAGLRERLRRDHRRAYHWTLGIAAVALLTVGGVVASQALAGTPAPMAASGPADGATGGQGTGTQGGSARGAGGQGTGTQGAGGQAAMLNATLSGANSPGPLTVAASSAVAAKNPQAAAARTRAAAMCAKARQFAKTARKSGFHRLARLNRMAARRCAHARHFARHLARRRMFRFFLLRGVDGQYTIQTPKGTKTQAFERGTIASVDSGKSIVVKTATGTVAWTWNLTSRTVVRDHGGKLSLGSLAAGQPVWVGGQVVSGAKDAALVVVRPPTPHGHGPHARG